MKVWVAQPKAHQHNDRRLLVGLALAIALGALPACNLQPKGGSARRSTRVPAPAWPFVPEQIRIHPLTRFVRDPVSSDVRIEVHLEFLDARGDEVKGTGHLLLELYLESGPVAGVGETRQLERWTLDLNDLDENANAYDRVTRTYRAALTGLPLEAQSGEHLLLRAVLTTPSGQRLAASHRLTP